MYVSSNIYDDVHAPGCYRLLAHNAMLSSLRNFNLRVIIGEVRESCVMIKVTGDSEFVIKIVYIYNSNYSTASDVDMLEGNILP